MTETVAAANLGVVHPPLVFLCSGLAGILVDLACPLPFLSPALAPPVGSSLVVVAIALFSWAVRELRAAGTPVPGSKPTTTIVRTGPYRISRNPIYLAFSLLQLGLASWVNTGWLVVTLVGGVALIVGVVIRREERYQEERFGVRRWL